MASVLKFCMLIRRHSTNYFLISRAFCGRSRNNWWRVNQSRLWSNNKVLFESQFGKIQHPTSPRGWSTYFLTVSWDMQKAMRYADVMDPGIVKLVAKLFSRVGMWRDFHTWVFLTNYKLRLNDHYFTMAAEFLKSNWDFLHVWFLNTPSHPGIQKHILKFHWCIAKPKLQYTSMELKVCLYLMCSETRAQFFSCNLL